MINLMSACVCVYTFIYSHSHSHSLGCSFHLFASASVLAMANCGRFELLSHIAITEKIERLSEWGNGEWNEICNWSNCDGNTWDGFFLASFVDCKLFHSPNSSCRAATAAENCHQDNIEFDTLEYHGMSTANAERLNSTHFNAELCCDARKTEFTAINTYYVLVPPHAY